MRCLQTLLRARLMMTGRARIAELTTEEKLEAALDAIIWLEREVETLKRKAEEPCPVGRLQKAK
jgi:hypothetical protein